MNSEFIIQAVFLGARVKDSGKVEWNDGTDFFLDGGYKNGISRRNNFSPSDCLIVHGNTNHGGESSLSKRWGDFPCRNKFGAVICQLKIDVFQAPSSTTVHSLVASTTPISTNAQATVTTTTTTAGPTSSSIVYSSRLAVLNIHFKLRRIKSHLHIKKC